MFVNFHIFLFLVSGLALMGLGLAQFKLIPDAIPAAFIVAAGLIAVIAAFTANRL